MNIVYIVVVLGVVLISMTLHEAMHGYVAYWLGDHTAKASGRLTLNPIAHIDPFMTLLLPLTLAAMGLPVFGGAKPVPFTPFYIKHGDFGVALMAIAGPLTNFVMAFIFFAIYALAGQPSESTVAGLVLSTGVVVNLGFFLFNIIPIPPLDGSRVLYAFAPEVVRRGMEWVERYGLLIVFLLVFLGSGFIGRYISVATSLILQIFSRLFGI